MAQATRIVYCHCAYVDVVPSEVRDGVLGKLCASGIEVEAVADLCELAARHRKADSAGSCRPEPVEGRDPRLTELADGATHIVACYPRAVRWLFAAGGAPLPEEGVELLNMREQSAEAIVEALGGDPGVTVGIPAAEKAQAIRSRLKAQRGDWIPWFPVIDGSRCKGCQQCLNFCLFGVYALDDAGRVEVRNPAGCKTWCPACARVCPEVAIIFPKHGKSPIHGGEVTEADESREKVAVDPAKLLQGDVYAALRARGKRFAADQDPERAREERLERLAALREQLDIPPEVIASMMGEGPCACECESSDGDCGPDCECHDTDEGPPRGCCD